MRTAAGLLTWAKKPFNIGGQNEANAALRPQRRMSGVLSQPAAHWSAVLAAVLWLSCGLAPANAAGEPEIVKTAQIIATAQYRCDEGCGDPPPRARLRVRSSKNGKDVSISLETLVRYLLLANVLQAIGLIIMAIRFSSRGPTIDLSNVKLEGKVDAKSG